MFGWDDALMIGGSLISGLGGGSDSEVASAPAGGFETLPDAVKKAYLETYLPGVLRQYDKPRTPIPLQRVAAPQTPFDSQELWNLQQFSDAVGGHFSPVGATLQQVYNPQGQQQAAAPAPGAANAEAARRWIEDMAAMSPGGMVAARKNELLARGDLANLGAIVSDPNNARYLKEGVTINDLFKQQYGGKLW